MNQLATTLSAKDETETREDLWHISDTVHSMDFKKIVLNLRDIGSIDMQIDTGAAISLISTQMWQQLGRPELAGIQRQLYCYDGHIIHSRGILRTIVEFSSGKCKNVGITIVDSPKTYGLLGRDLLED